VQRAVVSASITNSYELLDFRLQSVTLTEPVSGSPTIIEMLMD